MRKTYRGPNRDKARGIVVVVDHLGWCGEQRWIRCFILSSSSLIFSRGEREEDEVEGESPSQVEKFLVLVSEGAISLEEEKYPSLNWYSEGIGRW